jgi:hypothetical protein
VVVAVLLQLGFAAAFLVDAGQTNRTYDALSAHRVAVAAHTLGCAFVGSVGRSGNYSGHVCQVGFSYRDQQFTAYIPYGQNETFYVDPLDSSVRMSEVSFDKGPEETTGDIVIAALLVAGAVMVTVLHQIHIRRPGRR